MRNLIIWGLLFCCNFALFAQRSPYNIINIGASGCVGFTDTNFLNTLTYRWNDRVMQSGDFENEYMPIVSGVNMEYGYQPFIKIQPTSFLQLAFKVDIAYSNIKSNLKDQLNEQEYELNLKLRSYIPGAFAYLTLGKFELGGGVIYSFTNINVNDDFFGYNDKWHGENLGYEAGFGFSNARDKLVSFSLTFKYRGLFIEDLYDKYGRKIGNSDAWTDTSLKMSGLLIQMSLGLRFIEINPGETEDVGY
jgi:hypothetical protein